MQTQYLAKFQTSNCSIKFYKFIIYLAEFEDNWRQSISYIYNKVNAIVEWLIFFFFADVYRFLYKFVFVNHKKIMSYLQKII